MDVERLKLFVTIVEEGSLTGAAKRHQITQPAVSRSLKVLEADLGVALFERVGRGLEITAAGRALWTRAHEVLQRLEQVEREVHQAARPMPFCVRLGAQESVVTCLLPGLIAPWHATYPTFTMQWHTRPDDAELLHAVLTGRLDAVILSADSQTPDARALGAYRTGHYATREHFPSLEEVTRQDDLGAFPRVALQGAAAEDDITQRETPTASSSAFVSSMSALKALVLAGVGVGALPDFMIASRERELLVRAPLCHDPEYALYLVTGAHFTAERERELMERVGGWLAQSLDRLQARVH